MRGLSPARTGTDRFRFGCALCFLLLATSALAKERLSKRSFVFNGRTRTCYYYVPDQAGPLPVVVLLHGSGRNGEELAGPWKSLAAAEGFIVVAPDSYDPSIWDSDRDTPAFLHEAVNQVKASHAVDESRIYLFGHSGGAVYALILALVDSEYYAAAAAHAGALPSGRQDLFRYAKRRMPVAIWVGDHDSFFPVDVVKATKAKFNSNGFNLQLFILPNHTHFYDEVANEVDRKAWDFLRAAHLQATPDLASQK